MKIGLALFVFIAGLFSSPAWQSKMISSWATASDRSTLFQKSQTRLSFKTQSSPVRTIDVDATIRYQVMDGFGYTLTGGSAFLLHEKLSPESRKKILQELFGTGANDIGVSYVRLSMGASDLDANVFSYDDLPDGQTDEKLLKFSLSTDKQHLIPILKEILGINPAIKLMASPWSAPAWMKTNGKAKGGALRKELYAVYADYFVKYVKGMALEGITIDAVTLQNEPEHPGNTPSMTMTAMEQAEFVRDHLGPAFAKAGIKTKIIIYDHNCDHPNYPISVLDDRNAKKFIDGTAFHMYLGEITALTKVHNAHPDKNLYFTEQWTSGKGDFGGDLQWHVKNLLIGAPRNWAKTVLEWNLAADPEFNPHTGDGGCNLCLGALTIGDSVSRNVSYYIIAHASKFVRPGSVRIESTLPEGLPNVAFSTPEGKTVLIVLNESKASQEFGIRLNNKVATTSIPPATVVTYVW